MRPKLKADEYPTSFTLKLPVSLLIKIKAKAKSEDTTASRLAREIIVSALD